MKQVLAKLFFTIRWKCLTKIVLSSVTDKEDDRCCTNLVNYCTRILHENRVVLRLETLRKAWFFRIKGKGCGSIYLSQKAKCKSVLLSANFEM